MLSYLARPCLTFGCEKGDDDQGGSSMRGYYSSNLAQMLKYDGMLHILPEIGLHIGPTTNPQVPRMGDLRVRRSPRLRGASSRGVRESLRFLDMNAIIEPLIGRVAQ
jgi:hypothetical protein